MQLALQPGAGLGLFHLGQSLPETLAQLRSHRNVFRCVEVKYAEGASSQEQQRQVHMAPPDIALSLPEHGLHLLFDRQQRLRLIDVHDTTRLQLRYGSAVFGGAAQPPTFGRVCEAFGPAYPGEPASGQYPLQYPGVLFLFPLAGTPTQPQLPPPQQYQQQYGIRHPQQQQQQLAPPAATAGGLPVDWSAAATRILLHHGTAASLDSALAAPPPPLPAGSLYYERVEAVPAQGLLFCTGGQLVRFGDSPQDVVSELGEPTSTQAKLAPGPAAASAAMPFGPGSGAAAAAAPDYFFCYVRRGLDVLFCGTAHRVKKLVLHANAPPHPDFGLYAKANFRVHPAGGWSLPGGGGAGAGSGDGSEEAADSPLAAAYASAGSEGAASMKTAASESSLPAVEAAAPAGHPAAAAAAAAEADGAGARGADSAAGRQPAQQPATGLTAAYNMLVGLIDDVMHIDDGTAHGTAQAPGHGGMRSSDGTVGAAQQPGSEVVGAEAGSGGAGDDGGGGQASAAAAAAATAAAFGRPPRPPTSHPIPTPLPSSKSSSKKKKKKERQRALAAAKLLGGAGGGEESATDADTDASLAGDSAPSSIASSPGMTSFLYNIAASGGATSASGAGRPPTPPGACAAGAGGPGSGYSSEASGADFASRERRLECGSAFDGWSEAEDLALLVGGEEAAAPGGGGGDSGAASSQQVQQAGGLGQPPQLLTQQQAQPQKLRVSAAVQTMPAAEDELDGGAALAPGQQDDGADVAHSPDSPESFVMADSPALFDESATAAEYESVPRQRSSGTQTQPHLLSGTLPLRGSSTSASQLRRTAAAAASSAGVSVDGCLADIRAVFGGAAKPALHTRRGGGHPLGPTHLFAYHGVVFEVLRSGAIATVTLFEP